eukprot:18554-Pleurochrysis_carterae.AAC.1
MTIAAQNAAMLRSIERAVQVKSRIGCGAVMAGRPSIRTGFKAGSPERVSGDSSDPSWSRMGLRSDGGWMRFSGVCRSHLGPALRMFAEGFSASTRAGPGGVAVAW